MNHAQRAYRIYLLYNLASSAFFWLSFSVDSVYFVLTAHLNPLQLVLVGTALEGSIFLFETPTGIVADLYGRRLSVLIGVFLMGAGFLVQGSFTLFGLILLAQLLWGVGYTFTSGSLQAWISDEIGEERAGAAFLRGQQLAQIGALAGIIAGTAIGVLRLNLPIQLAGGLFLALGLLLVLVMPEHGFKPIPQAGRSTFANMLTTLRTGAGVVRARPALQSILWIGLFFGLFSEGFDRLWVAHMLEQFSFPLWQPVVWFGILRGAAMLLTAGAVELVTRRLDTTHMPSLARIMALCSAGLVGGLFLFALAGKLWLAAALFLAISVLREVISPLYTTWVNHRLDPNVRATVLSLSSQVDALGQIGGGPALGLLAQRVSIQAGLFGAAALLSPVLALFARLNRTAKSHSEQEIT